MTMESQSEAIQRKVEDFRALLHGAQLQQLFDYLPDVYFVVKNVAGEVMMANEVALRQCGFEREADMLGKSDYDMFTQDRADAYVADDRVVFETGAPILDRVELAPDPTNAIHWMVTTKMPLYSEAGEVVGLACIARNMTAAYERLRPYTEMTEVFEYIQQHYAETIKIDVVSRLAHLSTSQFERRFRKLFHRTPTQYITQVRIHAACNLLSSSHDTVASIALDVGFYDHSHFSRSFKKGIGMSPSEYRAQF
ncbi:MAG: AraC-like DNA-binding protein [Kiritimatiellia bacterium]|jgi:AraC-like DNA-binding protein